MLSECFVLYKFSYITYGSYRDGYLQTGPRLATMLTNLLQLLKPEKQFKTVNC